MEFRIQEPEFRMGKMKEVIATPCPFSFLAFVLQIPRQARDDRFAVSSGFWFLTSQPKPLTSVDMDPLYLMV